MYQTETESEDAKRDSLHFQAVGSQKTEHYRDWPNDAGFYTDHEQMEQKELRVSGKFPPWVAGTLLRNGPGNHRVQRSNPSDGEFNLSHWFDGFSHVHKFTILPSSSPSSSSADQSTMNDVSSTRVFYKSRYQADQLLEKARRTGKLEGITFAQKRDPCDSLFKKFKTVFEPIDARGGPRTEDMPVSFQKVVTPNTDDGKGRTAKVAATSDKCRVKNFDVETLEPYGVTSQAELHPSLTGPISCAHPQIDPDTGDLFNYNLAFGASAYYRIFRTSCATGETEILATISGRDILPAYVHSFFLTRNFVVLCIWPACIAGYGVKVLWERNMLDAISPFDKGKKSVWCVVDRREGRGLVAKFESDAMFAFHTVNAWEEQGQGEGSVSIVAELVRYPDTSLMHKFYLSNLVSTSPAACAGPEYNNTPALARYRLPDVPLPSTPPQPPVSTRPANLTQQIPHPSVGDLPSINPGFARQPHRYVYTVLNRGLSSFVDAVGKTDTLTRECKIWSLQGHTPSEAVFIANPEGVDEDDGVLLSVVLDGLAGSSYLLCLDARTMREVGRAEVGSVVDFGFHGIHLGA